MSAMSAMSAHPDSPFPGYDLSELDSRVRDMFCYARRGDHRGIAALLEQDPELARCSWGYVEPIQLAVKSGNAEAVRLLLRYGAVVAKSPIGWMDDPLTQARDRGLGEVADVLEQHLAQRHRSSATGMQLAAWIREGRDEEAIAALDRSPGTLHEADERGNTPLHWAALVRNVPLIDRLIARGANPDAERADGATAVQLLMDGDYWFRAGRDLPGRAVRNEWFMIGYMAARGAEIDACLSAAIGDTNRLERLLATDSSLANAANSCGRRPLGYAAKYGNTDALKLLLERGADPNLAERDAPRGIALWQALKGKHETCASLLLDYGADPNGSVESGGNCLYIATSSGVSSGLISRLYASGAVMGLDIACYLERIDVAGEMLGARPAAAKEGGDYGPLCSAVQSGNPDMVRLLLLRGADVNAPWYANNYMGYALEQDDVSFGSMFLKQYGADPNRANWLGVTYLHKAAGQGNMRAAELLAECGANINAVDGEHGSTPLGWAAKYGRVEMAKRLLELGADPALPRVEPWAQPKAWAERRGHADLTELLT